MYPCPNVGCNERFDHRMQLSRHLVPGKCLYPSPEISKPYVKLDDKYQCSGCQKLFTQQSNVATHQKVCKGSHSVDKKEWKCHKCPLTFRYKCRLNSHLACHLKDMCCPKCDRSFKRKDHFEKHLSTECTQAVYDTPIASTVTSTLLQASGEALVCPTCERRYKRRDFFDKHLEKCDSSGMIPCFLDPYVEGTSKAGIVDFTNHSNLSSPEQSSNVELPPSSHVNVIEHSAINLNQTSAINFAQPSAVNLAQPSVVNLAQQSAVSLAQPSAVNLDQSSTVNINFTQPSAAHLAQPLDVYVFDEQNSFNSLDHISNDYNQSSSYNEELCNSYIHPSVSVLEDSTHIFKNASMLQISNDESHGSMISDDINYDTMDFSSDSEDGENTDPKISRSMYFKEQKARRREEQKVEGILQTVSTPVRTKAFKNTFRGRPKTLEEVLAYTDVDSENEAKALRAVIVMLKGMYKSRKYGTFYKVFFDMFGEYVEDQSFMKWISSKLGMDNHLRFKVRLEDWKDRQFRDSRGRKGLSEEMVQTVYNIWIENSISSTDGSNGRNMVNIRKRKYFEVYHSVLEHKDVKIEESTNKRNQSLLSANRRIATCTCREIQKKLKEDKGICISLGKVVQLKPFFITNPSEKELALCLCKLCLNMRLLHRALMEKGKKDGDNISDSITEFFMGSSTCEKSHENGYFRWSCVSGKCKSCKNHKPIPLQCQNSSTTISVTQFETTAKLYKKDINGVMTEKISKKTERVEHQLSFQEIYEKLAGQRQQYLMHRFQVLNDRFHWPRVLAASTGPTYHYDFSENLPQMYKYEPQSSHFNKNQYSLHCTVKHLEDGSFKYLYHLSNDMKHDHAFTSAVVRHLNEIETEQSSIIRVKSDNCSVQYKSKKVFRFWRMFAQETHKTIIVYYGVSGHGKGLVDAMSAFGVKTPLRRAVVTEDFHYGGAEDICNYLRNKFREDDKKNYYLIDLETTAELRKSKESFKIKCCQKQHMLSFFPSGEVQGKINLCSCEKCVIGKFTQCLSEKGIFITGSLYDEQSGEESDSEEEFESDDFADDDDGDEDYQIRGDSVFATIDEGKTIAIATEECSFESFYLCLVNSIGIATEPLVDKNNHTVLPGQKYLSCQYYQKLPFKFGSRIVKYKLLPGLVYVDPAMVLAPLVNISDSNTLSIDEYIWLSDSA